MREDKILPFVMKLLGEEIKNLEEMLSSPPDELRQPNRARAERHEEAEADRVKLLKQIDVAEETIMSVEDARTRQSLDKRLTGLRDQLDELEVELDADQHGSGYDSDDLEALREGWADFDRRAVSVPIGQHNLKTIWHKDPEIDAADPDAQQAVMIDARMVNSALHELGCLVRLRWETVETTTATGGTRTRHALARGRFQLGQRNGTVPRYVLESSALRSWQLVASQGVLELIRGFS